MVSQRTEPIRSYQDLLVWKRAMQLLKETYVLTEQYPKRETYGITAQMRGAALSIPSNIAEGQGRPTTKDSCGSWGSRPDPFENFKPIAMLLYCSGSPRKPSLDRCASWRTRPASSWGGCGMHSSANCQLTRPLTTDH